MTATASSTAAVVVAVAVAVAGVHGLRTEAKGAPAEAAAEAPGDRSPGAIAVAAEALGDRSPGAIAVAAEAHREINTGEATGIARRLVVIVPTIAVEAHGGAIAEHPWLLCHLRSFPCDQLATSRRRLTGLCRVTGIQ